SRSRRRRRSRLAVAARHSACRTVQGQAVNGSRTMEPAAYLDSLRPAGSKRSTKRDLIVNVFLRQEGHLTADDLVDLIRREESSRSDPPTASAGMSRATVYRTLQWMVDAGIARKV